MYVELRTVAVKPLVKLSVEHEVFAFFCFAKRKLVMLTCSHNFRQVHVYYIKSFGKVFDPEFIKTPFLQTVKIKLIISLVTTSGIIGFDFTEKSQ